MDTRDDSPASFDAGGMNSKRIIITGIVVIVLAVAAIAAWGYWPREPLPEGTRADLVVVHKALRKMSLYSGEKLLRTYRIALGGQPDGHKRQDGDGKTPEGRYVLDSRSTDGAFNKALHISYPSIQDRIWASERALNPGGNVMIHGVAPGYAWLGRLRSWSDWTDGSIAVTNPEMDEIWRVVPDGTPIVIEPE